jgi:hypothetical protein
MECVSSRCSGNEAKLVVRICGADAIGIGCFAQHWLSARSDINGSNPRCKPGFQRQSTQLTGLSASCTRVMRGQVDLLWPAADRPDKAAGNAPQVTLFHLDHPDPLMIAMASSSREELAIMIKPSRCVALALVMTGCAEQPHATLAHATRIENRSSRPIAFDYAVRTGAAQRLTVQPGTTAIVPGAWRIGDFVDFRIVASGQGFRFLDWEKRRSGFTCQSDCRIVWKEDRNVILSL